jgi:hypothetical protein
MTDDDQTPAQRRAELLDDETVGYLADLAKNAPPLTEEQRDVIRFWRSGSSPESPRIYAQNATTA